MIFGCCFLGSFKPGHFHYPVTCRTEKNLLLLMATGRAGKSRPASLSAVVAAAGFQRPETALDSWAPSAWQCALGPQNSWAHLLGHLTEAKRPSVSAVCWTSWRTHSASLTDTQPEQSHLLLTHTCFLLTEHFLRSSQRFEQLIYILGNNCSLLALNKPLCLAETRECNMSFTKLSQESRDRLQKYALYSVNLSE